MLKEERQKLLLNLLEKNQVIKVTDITTALNVTDMTIRRDLRELEEKKLLVRVHGGALSINNTQFNSIETSIELNHIDKKNIYLNEKKEIAKIIANEIEENDTVFLGLGTTIELVYDYLKVDYAKIITNSIYVFDKFKYDTRFDLVMVGGSYRSKTGAFVGTIANDFLSSIHVQKSFIGVNGIENDNIYNSDESEGLTQSHILNSSKYKYIVADHSKFGKRDFYQFYSLSKIDWLITDSGLSDALYENYSQFIKIKNGKKDKHGNYYRSRSKRNVLKRIHKGSLNQE